MKNSITITTQHPASHYGSPVCLIDGEVVGDKDGLRACMDRLGWSRATIAEKTGKSLGAIDRYLYADRAVPVEVWNVLRDAL